MDFTLSQAFDTPFVLKEKINSSPEYFFVRNNKENLLRTDQSLNNFRHISISDQYPLSKVNSAKSNQTFCQEMLKALINKFHSKDEIIQKAKISKSTVNKILSGRIKNSNQCTFSQIFRLYVAYCYKNPKLD